MEERTGARCSASRAGGVWRPNPRREGVPPRRSGAGHRGRRDNPISTTWDRSWTTTSGPECWNTSSARSSPTRSCGSCSGRGDSLIWSPARTGSTARRSFPGSGSTQTHSWRATRDGSAPWSTWAAPRPSMRRSSPSWPPPAEGLNGVDEVVESGLHRNGLILMFLYQHGEPWSWRPM